VVGRQVKGGRRGVVAAVASLGSALMGVGSRMEGISDGSTSDDMLVDLRCYKKCR